MRTRDEVQASRAQVLTAARSLARAVGLPLDDVDEDLLLVMVDSATTAMRNTMIANAMEVPDLVLPWNEAVRPPSADRQPSPARSPGADRQPSADRSPGADRQPSPTMLSPPPTGLRLGAEEDLLVDTQAEPRVQPPVFDPEPQLPQVEAPRPHDFPLDQRSEGFISAFWPFPPIRAVHMSSNDRREYEARVGDDFRELVLQREYARSKLFRNPTSQASQLELDNAIARIETMEAANEQNKLAWDEHQRLARDTEVRNLVSQMEIYSPIQARDPEAILAYEEQVKRDLTEIYTAKYRAQHLYLMITARRQELHRQGAVPDPVLAERVTAARADYAAEGHKERKIKRENAANKQANDKENDDLAQAARAKAATSHQQPRTVQQLAATDDVSLSPPIPSNSGRPVGSGSRERVASAPLEPPEQDDVTDEEPEGGAPLQEQAVLVSQDNDGPLPGGPGSHERAASRPPAPQDEDALVPQEEGIPAPPATQTQEDEVAPTGEVVLTPPEVIVTFADKLAVEHWASDIFQLLQQHPQKEKSILGEMVVYTGLLMVKQLKPLFHYALRKHFSQELSQAEAAMRNGRSRKVELETQPLAFYCQQPESLKAENDLEASLRVFRDLRQDLKDLALKKTGADSWVWPVFERFTKDLRPASPEMIRTEELILSTLGVEFKKNYGVMSFTKADADLIGIPFDSERQGSGKADAKSKARSRPKNYYRNLAYLRENGQFWLVMCGIPNLYSLLGEISKVDLLDPWIKQFGSYPELLSRRAWSRAQGDYTGVAELAQHAAVSEAERQVWNDFACNWKTYQDQIEFNNSQHTPFPGILFDPIILLKYGYLAHKDLNMSWSIMLEIRGEDELYACSMVPIKAKSFIGFLPGNCIYKPGTAAQDHGDVFKSDTPDLFIDEEGCKGALSYMRRVSSFEGGNIIAGWEQHNDMTMPNSNAFHLVLFAYREIDPFEELLLWEHLKA
ncbi:hypothetical protein D6C93_01006 [Aureobasidium pullulans]|nr:hypothetical protein D6C93_01006 [Aureobasidium pullulans]